MLFPRATFVAALAGLLSTIDGKLLESLNTVPRGWEAVGYPSADKVVMLRIAMAQPNLALFEQAAYDIATPGHARYGQHMKRHEIKDLLRPYPKATSAVLAWLKDSGVSSDRIVDDGDWINFYTDVVTAETMLDTTFAIYSNARQSLQKVRTLHYSVPEELHGYIDMIQPTTRFGEIQSHRSFVIDKHLIGSSGETAVPASCNDTITPTCLRDLYNVQDLELDPQKIGYFEINGFLDQYANYADYDDFVATYAPYLSHTNFTYQLINGGLANQSGAAAGTEANLDVQYGLSMAYPNDAVFFSTGGLGPLVPDLDEPTEPGSNEPYLDFLPYILSLPDDQLPHTLSTSYGEDEQSVPAAYQKRVCSLFGQLGARGVSVLFSSGDTGPGSNCESNDGTNKTTFNPIFPAGCPMLTSVGGTYGVNPERAVSFSAGGFSSRIPRPAYQNEVVPAYLKTIGDTFEGLFDPAGRAFPDVAAQSVDFEVYIDGEVYGVDGTSCAAPTFAGIIALVNAARKNKGLPGLGFLNPWLYSTAYPEGALTDVTEGGSKGCTGTDIYTGLPARLVIGAGWNATVGWDPVTGLGTPLFDRLLKLAL